VLFLFNYISTNKGANMNNTIITIPLSTDLDHSQLLEIIQGLTDEIQNLIEDAGGDCAIDELDVGVGVK
tara:strand:- start:1639 stop:1845 length:207 start_codon:yes stop_codon:yes gene_type:complete